MLNRWLTLLRGGQKATTTEERPVRVSTATPKVEHDSTLAVVASMNADDAANYITAVEAEIQRCIDDFRVDSAASPIVDAYEQIHRLKNSIAPTGSPELMHACEQLRKDATVADMQTNLEARYKAIAVAALHAVRQFKTTDVDCTL